MHGRAGRKALVGGAEAVMTGRGHTEGAVGPVADLPDRNAVWAAIADAHAARNAESDLDGWLLGASINLDAKASELHVFDARRVASGPICSWRADVALPISLHGQFKGA